MNDRHALLWLLLLATLIWCAWWHTRENRAIAKEWKDKKDDGTAKWITHFAWSRTAQLLAALAVCTGIVIMYGIELSNAENTIAELNKEKQDSAKQFAEQLVAAQHAAAPIVAAQPATPAYYPPTATAAQAAQIPVPKEASPSPETASPDEEEKPATVADVYNTEQTDNSTSAALDAIKKRYEDVIVTYFYLSKCGKAHTQDYQLVLDALDNDLTANHAPAGMRDDVIDAAQGSYQEVYANTRCETATIAPLSARFSDYTHGLSQPHMPDEPPPQMAQPAPAAPQPQPAATPAPQPKPAPQPDSGPVILKLNPPGTPLPY